MIVPVGWSYAGYLTAPGDAPVSVRSVDWLREHGFASEVNRIEQWWYTRTKPTGVRAPAVDLPSALRVGTSIRSRPAASGAERIATAVVPAQAGEGLWVPVTGLAIKSAFVDQAFIRPDPAYPSVVANVVRFDQHATKLVLVPGLKDPGGSHWAWGSQIPTTERSTVVAAFNAGFKFADTPGGLYTEGRLAVRTLKPGVASIVIHRNGTADITRWGSAQQAGGDIISVRQNLALIVDAGRPVSGLLSDRGGLWGTLRSQFQFTWRSGLGVDARGRLIYVAGSRMTLTELAAAMTDAGAVRAMQLDIHTNVVTFNWFRPAPTSSLGVTASKLMPSMQRDATRFLSPDQRDFFTLVAR